MKVHLSANAASLINIGLPSFRVNVFFEPGNSNLMPLVYERRLE